MNYQSIYNQLVAKYKDHPKVKFETNDHHIIPQCFAKIDNIEDIDGRWNRVHLPHRVHFIAHLLLARIWKHHKVKGPKMARAINIMQKDESYNSRKYSCLKLNYSHSEESKMKMKDSAKKRPAVSKETRQKMSETRRGKYGQPKSEETRRKISESKKGKSTGPLSEETKAKLRRPRSEETKKKISEGHLRRRLLK